MGHLIKKSFEVYAAHFFFFIESLRIKQQYGDRGTVMIKSP